MQIQTNIEAFRSKLNFTGSRKPREMLGFEKLIQIAKRQWRIFALLTLLAAVGGLVYVLTAEKLYTARISVLMDDGNGKVIGQLGTVGDVVNNENAVFSQVELLQSQAIAGDVVDRLKLVDDDDFMAVDDSLLSSLREIARISIDVRRWFVPNSLDRNVAEERRRMAIEKIVSAMNVTRVARTYVINVNFTSPSPAMAAKIANAIGDAYLRDKLNSKYEATLRASNWLNSRITELRQQSLSSDLAVQQFRRDNGLLSAGNVLLSDQQLQEMSKSLIDAQEAVAQAEARYNRIQQILVRDDNEAIVTDVLDSSISNQLRRKYLDASKLEGEISAKLGPNHQQAIRVRREMEVYKQLMFDELQRIAQSYSNELDVARAQEKSALANVTQAQGVTVTANTKQVQLRELERTADTYRNLYESFLQRYQEAVQQQSFPITDARIISQARVPSAPSYPRTGLLWPMFVVAGAALGVCAGAFREFRDRYFRTGDQIRSELGLEFIGTAPLLKPAFRNVDNAIGEIRDRDVHKIDPISNHVIDHPISSFTETLRSAKIIADLALPSHTCRILGIVSTLPGEGKSTIAVNFAELIAKQGARTVLIDCDLRNPGSTRAIGRHAKAGLLEVILKGMPLGEVMLHNPQTKLAFLPATVTHRIPHSSELLTSDAMRDTITALSAVNDYIILDLPPIGPVVDARAMAPRIDGFIYVTEWGKTSRRIVRHTIETEPRIAAKCLGVILNKVDYEKMKLYRSFGSIDYYYTRYQKYYSNDA